MLTERVVKGEREGGWRWESSKKLSTLEVGLGDLASSSPNLLCVQYGPAEVVAAPLSFTLRAGWTQGRVPLLQGVAGQNGESTRDAAVQGPDRSRSRQNIGAGFGRGAWTLGIEFLVGLDFN